MASEGSSDYILVATITIALSAVVYIWCIAGHTTHAAGHVYTLQEIADKA